MKRTPHTHFPKGAHVFIILTDGHMFDDIFIERLSRVVVLRTNGKVLVDDIKSMSYRRLS
jgi:hypothetical protein